MAASDERVRAAYARLSDGDVSLGEARLAAHAVAEEVAGNVRQAIPSGRALVVFVLRGALLMVPSFYREFARASFGLLAMQRTGETVTCEYVALPTPGHYGTLVVVDAVAGSGATILATERVVGARGFTFDRKVAAVIAASAAAHETLLNAGWETFGHSLEENDCDGLVVPDLGSRDAGDMAIGADAAGPFPSAAFFPGVRGDDKALAARQLLIYAPVIDEVRELRPKSLADLGCGDGSLTRQLAGYADTVTAFDESAEALHLARAFSSTPRVRYVGSRVGLAADAPFDCLVCSMVLNVVDDIDEFVSWSHGICGEGSAQVWVLLHPAFQYNRSQWQAKKRLSREEGVVSYDVVPSYFDEGTFVKEVGGARVLEHHRPLSRYLNLLVESGFSIERVVEPRGEAEDFIDHVYPRVITIVTRKVEHAEDR